MKLNTRYFLLPVVLAAILFTLGCTDCTETPQPDEKQKAPSSPQAPAPHLKKTAAELLVGKWKQVEWKGKPIPKEWKFYREFTADGKFRIFMDDRKLPATTTDGTYEVVGDVIRQHTLSSPQGRERKWDNKICLISEDELEISFKDDGVTEKKKFKRVGK